MKESLVKPTIKKAAPVQPKKKRELSKNPVLNEILNNTEPFSAVQRSDKPSLTDMMGGSVLDMVHRKDENDWGTMNLSTKNLSYEPTPSVTTMESTGNEAVDVVAKALARDYSELVKRFK